MNERDAYEAVSPYASRTVHSPNIVYSVCNLRQVDGETIAAYEYKVHIMITLFLGCRFLDNGILGNRRLNVT